MNDAKAKVRADYGENRKISDGNYDKSLAVKCVNGTFIGRKKENIIAYKGIPFCRKAARWRIPLESTGGFCAG